MHGRVSFTGDKRFVVFSEFFTLQNSSPEIFLFVNHKKKKKTLERRPNYRNMAEIFPFFFLLDISSVSVSGNGLINKLALYTIVIERNSFFFFSY